MIITKKSLPRRTVLRGMGASLALPLLDAMVPAATAAARTAAKPVPRLGFFYIPNGTVPHAWTPKADGAGFEFSRILQPLEPLRRHVLVLSGLDQKQANSQGDGNNPHQRASAVWLSGVHALTSTIGAEIRLGVTADQLAAEALGKETPLPSLEYTLDSTNVLSCDGGLCSYQNTLSWRSPTTPLPMEGQPRAIFERLFGDGGTPAQRLARMRKHASILDSVAQEAAALERTVGAGDRARLSEYLDSVREVEQRIQRSETRGDESLEVPARPTGIPDDFDDYTAMMFDLHLLAYQGDMTRVTAAFIGREGSGRAYPQIGVRDPHHSMSHHRNDTEMMERKIKIDTYHVELLARFLQRLRDTPDGDGSLLDHAMILYGGGIYDGNLHTHVHVPLVLAGGGCGTISGGRHIRYPNLPMTNLLLTMLDKAGVPAEKLGDSSGKLHPDYLSNL